MKRPDGTSGPDRIRRQCRPERSPAGPAEQRNGLEGATGHHGPPGQSAGTLEELAPGYVFGQLSICRDHQGQTSGRDRLRARNPARGDYMLETDRVTWI